MLAKLRKKKQLNIVGVNSGTSVDSLDLSLVRISERKNSGLRITELAHRSIRYQPEMRERLLTLGHSPMVNLDELALTDEALGAFIGKGCRRFIRDQLRNGVGVDLVASHGQTIRHLPKHRMTLGECVNGTVQIGSAERIAALTSLPVVSHFRQADTSVGGEGAPITTPAVCSATCSSSESRLIVNIGGIANLFYIPASKRSSPATANSQAFDVGPGNMLLDMAAQKLFSAPFDKSGEFAASGKVSLRLLALLENERFFGDINETTQSTGRERYGESALDKVLTAAKKLRVQRQDILATLSQLTAERILLTIRKYANSDEKIISAHITGGGLKNKDLIRRIRAGLPDLNVLGLKDIGYHPDFFEALCYAILGYYCIRGISVPATLTARSPRPVLGRISQPPSLD